jgi:DUF4097 and DUF4098 domain-containing protein YvlB
MKRLLFVLPFAALVASAPTAAVSNLTVIDHAPTLPAVTVQGQDWCSDAGRYNDRDETFCEVRELKDTGSRLEILDNSNGSITVTGSSRRDIAVQARVMTSAETLADARALAKEVTVTMEGGRVRATGPSSQRRRSWWISYRADVPTNADLSLETSNGSVAVTGVKGRIDATSSNGALRLTDLGGRVNARTSNGAVHVSLTGSQWDGDGLTVVTSNGAARVNVPEKYNARLIAGTNHGSIDLDIPVTVQGRISKQFETTLGAGGASIDVRTSNGSVRIGRR